MNTDTAGQQCIKVLLVFQARKIITLKGSEVSVLFEGREWKVGAVGI